MKAVNTKILFLDILGLFLLKNMKKIKYIKSLQKAKFPVISNYIFINKLGYGGYIPHVKAENMFGKTYGKTTFLSN